MRRTLIKRVKSFDIFRKIERDLLVTTKFGATVSILAIVFVTILVFKEAEIFAKNYTSNRSRLVVRGNGPFQGKEEDAMRLSFDISFPNIPCGLLAIVSNDYFGSTGNNGAKSIEKNRIFPGDDSSTGGPTKRRRANSRRLLFSKTHGILGSRRSSEQRKKTKVKMSEVDESESHPMVDVEKREETADERRIRLEEELRSKTFPDLAPFSSDSSNESSVRRTVLSSQFSEKSTGPECVAWRQTKDCDPDGEREPTRDLLCRETISPGVSGFCECRGGARAAKVMCHHDVFCCKDECQHMWDMQTQVVKSLTLNHVGGGEEMPRIFDRLLNCGSYNNRRRVGTASSLSSSSIPAIVSPSEMSDLRHRGDERGGCRVRGFLDVTKVPGSMTFASRAPVDLLRGTRIDMSHRIRQFRITEAVSGEEKDEESVVVDGSTIDDRYFEATKESVDTDGNEHVVHEHFLRVVETRTWTRDPAELDSTLSSNATFSFTTASDSYPLSDHESDHGGRSGCVRRSQGSPVPHVRFTYDVDALAIETWPVRASVSSFVISLFAILGGVTTFLQVLDSCAYRTARNKAAAKTANASTAAVDPAFVDTRYRNRGYYGDHSYGRSNEFDGVVAVGIY
eukprot:g2872.t1